MRRTGTSVGSLGTGVARRMRVRGCAAGGVDGVVFVPRLAGLDALLARDAARAVDAALRDAWMPDPLPMGPPAVVSAVWPW